MMTRFSKLGLLGVWLGSLLVFTGCGGGSSDSPTDPIHDDNEFPTVVNINITPANAIFVGDTVTLTPMTTDPNADALRYTWTKSTGTFNPLEAVGSSIQWTAPDVAGVYQVIVVADDGNGGTSRKQLDLQVLGGNQSGIAVDVVGGKDKNPVGGVTDLGYVDKGDTVTLVWDGGSPINVNANQPTINDYAPDGTNLDTGTPPQYGWADGLPNVNAARYCLVGQIAGTSDWFTFTQAGNVFTAVAPARGRLFLRINEQDALLVDNTGYWHLIFSNAH